VELLFENWRYYLNERATDALYQKIVDFLINTTLNKKFFDMEEEGVSLSAEEIEKFLAMIKDLGPDHSQKPDKDIPKFKEYDLTVDEESGRLGYLWDEYQRRIPEDNQIFADYETFETFMGYFNIKIIYAPKDMKEAFEAAEMEIYAHMTDAMGAYVFDPDEHEKFIVINYAHFMPYEKYEKMNENSLWASLRSYKKALRTVLEHEFTHLLNRVRTGTTGGTEKKRGWTKKKIYINSTEEIQARLVQIFQIVEKSLRQPQKTHILPRIEDVIKLISLEVNGKNVKNATKYLLQLYKTMFPGYWELTRQNRKQKIATRLYDFAQQLIQKKDSYSKIKRMNK
tara:strand:- start:79055 stop:80074 length:1020 start_codon:yes stop_codon:yes gene_type:complete